MKITITTDEGEVLVHEQLDDEAVLTCISRFYMKDPLHFAQSPQQQNANRFMEASGLVQYTTEGA